MYSPKTVSAGDRFGSYILEKRLWQGPRGEGWLARHADKKDLVVTAKLILRPHSKEMELVQHEATILKKLRACRNVVNCEGFGEERGIPYLLLEFLPGEDLSRRLTSKFTLEEISQWVGQIAEGLNFCHLLGIVHRNIKPNNILFRNDGTPVIANFGVAKDATSDPFSQAGTPEYQSPEQFDDCRKVGAGADIYALGIMAFQLITARLPFGSRPEGKTVSELVQAHREKPLPLVQDYRPEVPFAVQQVLERALAKKPEQRYQNALEFASDFDAAIYGPITEDTIKVIFSGKEVAESVKAASNETPGVRVVSVEIPVPSRNRVFISCSKQDTRLLERLHIHLRPLERSGVIQWWDETQVKPGQNLQEELQAALQSARIAVLMISADLLASEAILNNHLPPLLKAAESQGTRVIPVILSPSLFEKSELSVFQPVNPVKQPLCDMDKNEREEVFVKLANTIAEALQEGQKV